MNSLLQPWLRPEQPGWRQLLLFKAGWFGLVLQPVYSAAVVLLLLVWWLLQLKPAQRLTVFTLWGSGLLLDTLLLAGGVFQFDSVWCCNRFIAQQWCCCCWFGGCCSSNRRSV